MFFEVLDNLPHDKLIWNKELSKYTDYVKVDIESKQQSLQKIEKDSLIRECLEYYLESEPIKSESTGNILDKIANFIVSKKLKAKSKDLFLPTYLLSLLQNFKNNIPEAKLIISDFDSLIDSISGTNAPVVSNKGQKSQDKRDFDTYLVDRGQADIFFPVNFSLLKTMHQKILHKDSHVLKTYEFVDEFSHEKWASTKSGFNPVKEDFSNTSFFLTKI